MQLAVASLIGDFKKQAQQVIDDIIKVVSQWDDYATQADVFDPLANEIKQNHRLNI